MVDAIVLGGSPNDRDLQEVSSEPFEAMISLAGKPMVEYVLSALEESPSVSSVVLVGPAALGQLHYSKIAALVEGTGPVMENLKLGLEKIEKDDFVLLTTADIPLLTAEAVEDFIRQSLSKEGDLFYSIVAREVNEASFPGVGRTYVRLREGTFTGGNLFLFHPRIVDQCWSFVEGMVNLRKNPLRMCAQLGWLFILRLLLGRLSIAGLEKRVGSLLGVRARAIISAFPGVGIDVDKVSDFEVVKGALTRDQG